MNETRLPLILHCGRLARNTEVPTNALVTRSRLGLSLLEVVLSLAILAVASAYLAQSVYLATENAIRSQKLSQAELVAESLMNQIVSGVRPAQPVTWVGYAPPNPFGPGANLLDASNWVYSIAIVNTEVQGMIGIQIAVQQVEPGSAPSSQPDLTVVRWIIDPNLGLDTPPAAPATPLTATPAESSRSALNTTLAQRGRGQ